MAKGIPRAKGLRRGWPKVPAAQRWQQPRLGTGGAHLPQHAVHDEPERWNFGEVYNYFSFSAATGGTRNRFAVVGALQGTVSLTFLGCQ